MLISSWGLGRFALGHFSLRQPHKFGDKTVRLRKNGDVKKPGHI
jgi:hypothetical protein